MYSTSNREPMPRGKNTAGLDDVEILERAIALVEKNAPEHHDLIGRLAATAQSLSGIEPICGLTAGPMTYTDRPGALARTVLSELRYTR